MRRKRQKKYSGWMTARMNLEGSDDLGDRLEILWGPDHLGRYALYLFQGKVAKICYSDNLEYFALPIVDKIKEIEDFDVEKGFRRIGITRGSHPYNN